MTFYDKYLEYNNGTGELPEGAFRISASRFNLFMTAPHVWYREAVLGEEGFTGNTSSVIGTIVHGVAAAKANGEEPVLADIERYINTFTDNPEVDLETVRNDWRPMAMTLVNDYVLHQTFTAVEPFVSHEMYEGYYPSGSIDAVQNGMIVDYKTYNSATRPSSIPMNYRYQLLIYAYICIKNNTPIDRIRLVYISRPRDTRSISEKTGKPIGKISPPEVTVLTESITSDDIDFIESVLSLCIETVITAKDHPELAYMLFRDYRLKEK